MFPAEARVTGVVGQYERKGLYPVEAVLDRLCDGAVDFDGDLVKMSSQRYRVFRDSLDCCACGLRGGYFAKERSVRLVDGEYVPANENPRYHFNLYGVTAEGEEILFTKDHIIPKSKGGKDWLTNYRTMCQPCNSKRGNKDL